MLIRWSLALFLTNTQAKPLGFSGKGQASKGLISAKPGKSDLPSTMLFNVFHLAFMAFRAIARNDGPTFTKRGKSFSSRAGLQASLTHAGKPLAKSASSTNHPNQQGFPKAGNPLLNHLPSFADRLAQHCKSCTLWGLQKSFASGSTAEIRTRRETGEQPSEGTISRHTTRFEIARFAPRPSWALNCYL